MPARRVSSRVSRFHGLRRADLPPDEPIKESLVPAAWARPRKEAALQRSGREVCRGSGFSGELAINRWYFSVSELIEEILVVLVDGG